MIGKYDLKNSRKKSSEKSSKNLKSPLKNFGQNVTDDEQKTSIMTDINVLFLFCLKNKYLICL